MNPNNHIGNEYDAMVGEQRERHETKGPKGGDFMSLLIRWVNKFTSPEGCTAVDAAKLKNFNFQLAMENHNLMNAVCYICNECQKAPNDSVRDIANEAFNLHGLKYTTYWTGKDEEPISISPNAEEQSIDISTNTQNPT